MTDIDLQLKYRGVVQLLISKHNELMGVKRWQGCKPSEEEIAIMEHVASDFNEISKYTEMIVQKSGDCGIFSKDIEDAEEE